MLFFIHIPTRQVFYAGTTANPTGAWTTQAARNLFLRHANQLADSRALVRDRGSQFIESFDEIFRTEGLKILKSPVRTPVANAFAERWIGSIRRELLDRTIIWNQRQLERLVVDPGEKTTFGTEQCNGRSLRGNDGDSVRYRGVSQPVVIGQQPLEVIAQIEGGGKMNRVE